MVFFTQPNYPFKKVCVCAHTHICVKMCTPICVHVEARDWGLPQSLSALVLRQSPPELWNPCFNQTGRILVSPWDLSFSGAGVTTVSSHMELSQGC